MYVLVFGVMVFGVMVSISLIWGGGDLVVVGGKVVLLFILLGIVDFLVYYIYVFMIYVMVLMFLKGVLFVCSFCLMLDKVNFGFCFFCDGFGSGGMC